MNGYILASYSQNFAGNQSFVARQIGKLVYIAYMFEHGGTQSNMKSQGATIQVIS